MFTGIVEEIGKVKRITKGGKSFSILIEGKKIFDDLIIGHSVCVNGVCLTATTVSKNEFTADVMVETINRSSLSNLKVGSNVNLERAMASNGRFGGHIVSGHIDGVGKISAIKKDENAIWYTIKADSSILKYIVLKGSVALDGISLTVAKVTKNDFSVSIIPHTKAETTLGFKIVGDVINIENDVVGKYIEKFVSIENSAITKDFLLS